MKEDIRCQTCVFWDTGFVVVKHPGWCKYLSDVEDEEGRINLWLVCTPADFACTKYVRRDDEVDQLV